MKKSSILFLIALFAFYNCSRYSDFYNIAAGSGIGGMFGSAIGGLMGGPRGSDAGTLVGMVAGGVIAAAAVENQAHTDLAPSDDYVDYDYSPRRQYNASNYNRIVVRTVTFNDENGNRCLDSQERAYIILDIYNEGTADAFEVAPTITCDNRRVVISPTAIISSLPSGRGVRYKAAITTRGKVKDGIAQFKVSFDGGRTTVKTFRIQTKR